MELSVAALCVPSVHRVVGKGPPNLHEVLRPSQVDLAATVALPRVAHFAPQRKERSWQDQWCLAVYASAASPIGGPVEMHEGLVSHRHGSRRAYSVSLPVRVCL